MGESVGIFLGGLIVILVAALAMETWLLAWERRVPSPLVRLLRRVAVSAQRMDSPDIALAQKSCPECPSVARCRAWIASGRVSGYGDFCPNAVLVERLAERPRP